MHHFTTFYNTQTQTSLFVCSTKASPKVLRWIHCRMSKPPARELLKIIAERWSKTSPETENRLLEMFIYFSALIIHLIKTQDLTMYIPQNLPLNVYVFSQDGHPTKPQFIQQFGDSKNMSPTLSPDWSQNTVNHQIGHQICHKICHQTPWGSYMGILGKKWQKKRVR